ncbi:hypothetical protein PWT90_08146 [Aphanocladium album]|nr:hypothetical protein PWT90_08146 [Aphanocladium album]
MALPGDNTWWPVAFPIFDFTLKFEETMFEILPSSLFLVCGIVAFFYYHRQPVYIHDGPLLWLKLIVGALLVGFQIAILALRLIYEDYQTDTTTAASVLDLVAAIGLCAALHIEHRHAIRSSAFIGLYLALRILFDAAQSRSYLERSFPSVGVFFIMAAVVRLSLLLLEEVPKANLIIDPIIRNSSGGEAVGGFWSRSLYFFLSPIFRVGTRGSLRMENLIGIGMEFDSKVLHAQLANHWKKSDWEKPHALFFSCCRAWKGAIVAALVPRLILIGLTFGQPFTMERVITSVDEGQDSTHTKGGLVGATILTFAGSPICRAIAMQMIYRLLTRFRGGLVSHMLDKSLRLELPEAKKNAAITLMTADFDGISEGFPLCFDIPFSFIESGIGIYFLAKFIKQSSFVVIFPLIFATTVGIILGKFLTPAMKNWNQKIQSRVSKTSQVLAQLPAMKMLGLGPKAVEFVQHLRELEIRASQKYRSIQSGAIASATLADLLTPTIVVAAALFWGTLGDELSADVMYPTLAIVAIVQAPLARLFRAYPLTMAMMGCFERIQAFLAQDEHEEDRVALGDEAREVTRAWPTGNGGFMKATKTIHRDPTRVIYLEDVSLAPRGSDKIVLKNLDLFIAPGSTTTVFGPTGSGKTTLLQGILGEAEIRDGIIYIDDVAIALVGQSTYLPNMSIRDCIVGSCEYDEELFTKVITDCQLLEDIEHLPGRENYVVGTGGMALSGGQRQRVSLARAAFARTPIVLLDDPFSALDRDTARSILYSLCGTNGHFQESGTTVVLTSYLPECLDLATSVVYLDGHGNLSCEHGNVDAAFRAQIMSLLRQEGKKSAQQAPNDVKTEQPSNVTKAGTAVQREKESTHQDGDWRLYVFWMDEIGRLALSIWLILIGITGFGDGLPRVYLKYWIENAPSSRLYFVGYAILPVVLATFCGGSVYYLFNHLCPRASLGLHKQLANTVIGSTLGFLSTTDSGSHLNRFSIDMDVLTKKVPPSLHNTFYYGVGCAVQVGIALSSATYMTALFPVILLGLYFIQLYYLRTSRQLRRLELEAQAPLVTALREAAEGLAYIRCFGWQRQTMAHCLVLLNESQRPIYLLYSAQQLLGLVTGLLAALIGIVLAIVVLFTNSASSGNSTGLSFLAVVVLGNAFNQLILAWTGLETAIGSLSRMRSFMAETPTESDGEADALPEFWPSRGEIQIQNVSARYRADEKRQAAVLQNISVNIKAGQKVGLTGRTGSGKSSLLYTLLGFLDYDGTIIIDGVNIAKAPRDELRSRVITISQDQVELDGTVRDNLLPFDQTWGDKTIELDEKGKEEAESKDRIAREALVRLRIWDKVEQLGGLDAAMQDVGYSHGEKQLLCIARAVVRRRVTGSKLVLVDEATGTVDSWRDQLVREMMKEYFHGCTILVVAHREESIADSNVTIEMANGRMGTPQFYY